MAVVMITHDLGVIARVADRVQVMYAGRAVEKTDVESLFDAPTHPYTEGLLRSIPLLGHQRLLPIPGSPPNMLRPPSGLCVPAPLPLCPRRVCTVSFPSFGRWDATSPHASAPRS